MRTFFQTSYNISIVLKKDKKKEKKKKYDF